MSVVWVVLWAVLGADSPARHPTISRDEVLYIENSLKNNTKELKTPWKSIFTSVPVYALIFAHLGNGWGFAVIITQMPSYINSVLGFNITTNGFLSALPYLSMWLLTFPVCWTADVIKKRNLLSDTVSRKMWTTFALSGCAISLIALGMIGRDATAAIALLTVAVSFSACIFCGYNINHLDLAPNYAGVLVGVANGLENITTILGPLSVGWFVSDQKSVEEWRLVFFVTACVAITGNLIFLIFGSAQTQPWNDSTKGPHSDISAQHDELKHDQNVINA